MAIETRSVDVVEEVREEFSAVGLFVFKGVVALAGEDRDELTGAGSPCGIDSICEVDLVERTRYYRNEGGDNLGGRFFDAAISSLDAIGRMPLVPARHVSANSATFRDCAIDA